MAGLIYKARNKINGKSYIGQTIKLFNKRINDHKYYSKSRNSIFYKAIKKYGWDNFEWSILHNNIPIQYLNEMEKFYIFLFNTYKEGYNSTIGGEDNPMFNLKSREKLSKSLLGKPSGMLGKKHTEETKKKISEANKGEKCYLFGKISKRAFRYKITEPNGNINIVIGLTKYCKENNLSQFMMWNICNGLRKYYKGYKVEKING